ncbi:MAG: hypothetical protein OIN85_01760 [Candidatus Methanoperedens sp.]|nr:hypothetical protein [Candidatus Methanoperedens sp.]
MESKYKTLIPLIIIFFIIGVAVGYVAHKPVTIEKIVTVTVTPIPTTTPISTPIPTLTLISTPIPTLTATATPTVSDFTVRNYDPSTDTPTKKIELINRRANPTETAIHLGDTVLIEITDSSLTTPLTLSLDSYSKNLGTSGAAFITFNKKGTYTFKAIASSPDPNVLPSTYGEGTITVY